MSLALLICQPLDFYPRSPCGERRSPVSASTNHAAYFYPRSPCGERPMRIDTGNNIGGFLSTLSLRRATGGSGVGNWPRVIFLSTLSLRRATYTTTIIICIALFLSTLSLRRATISGSTKPKARRISIHALLAESDY